jgi:hypothetical protein
MTCRDASFVQPRSALRSAALAAGLLVVLVPHATAQDSSLPDWAIESLRWHGDLNPSQSLEIQNPWGDVRLRASDAGEVETSAVVQRRKSDPVLPEVKVERVKGVLRIVVGYPEPPTGDLYRVDLAVFVPKGVYVVVETRDGMIEARGVSNDLRLRTIGGEVKVANKGGTQVSTVRGDVTLELGVTSWREPPRIASDEGDVSVRLAENSDARIRIRAAGEISLPPEARVLERRGRRALVTVGKGTQTMHVESRRGSVTLMVGYGS